MKRSLKLTLGLLAIGSISAIAVGSVVSCSNDSSSKSDSTTSSSKSSSSTASPTVSTVEYSNLSKKVISNPTTQEPFTNYSDALVNWQDTYKNLTSTQTGYENIITSALDSFFKSSNSLVYKIPLVDPFSSNDELTNYQVEYDFSVPTYKVTFGSGSQDKDVTITASDSFTEYLINSSNSNKKYSLIESESNFTLNNVNFSATLTKPIDLNNQTAFSNLNYYGGITISKIGSESGKSIILENKALESLSNPYLWIAKIGSDSSLLQSIMTDSTQAMVQYSPKQITTTTNSKQTSFMWGIVSTYNGTYDYGSEIQPQNSPYPNPGTTTSSTGTTGQTTNKTDSQPTPTTTGTTKTKQSSAQTVTSTSK